ncbi:MAG: TfoX/Sxy family protein [Rhodocyclaceae bacterium]|nr:TfoX/Sxy family protein [Rhodocyclaceae bacterium]
MTTSREFVDWVVELLEPLGRVVARRMFGGYGLFLDGLMFAIVIDDVVWFKTDQENRALFVSVGESPFTYLRAGKPAQLNFYRAPDDAFASPHALMPWAQSAFGAALRARTKPTGGTRGTAKRR